MLLRDDRNGRGWICRCRRPILVGSSTSSASPVSPGSGIAETVEHPFGTLKMRMGATHFLMKRLPKVVIEMALHVLAYNLTRVMNIVGIQPLMAAMRASSIPKTMLR